MRPNAFEYCQACGRERQPADFVCLACECTIFGPELPVGVVPEETAGGEVGGPLAGRWRLPAGRVSLWHGQPGAGKTSLALLTLPGATVIDLEQDAGLLARLRAREQLPAARTVSPVFEEGVVVDLGLGEERPTDLIFDSLTAAGDDLAAAQVLVRYCATTGARAIAIVHETTDGTAWGGNQLPHLVHSQLRVTEEATGRQVRIVKDRSGPTGIVPWRMRVDPAPAPRYVSVEGRTGRYALVEHPDPKARLAGPYRLAEDGELELPPPPLAVAATPSALYPSGWHEPADVDRRQAYAEAQGFRFYRPPPRPRTEEP